MPTYHIYTLADNRFDGDPATVDFSSDADVTEFAKQFLDGLDIEVLDGTRSVIRLYPAKPK